MSALIVSANGICVGTLEVEQGQWKFGYSTEWKDYALSPTFPISTRAFEDTANTRTVEWFFENLLPEGRLRDLIALRDRIDPRDTWALLILHGQDTAGALSLTPEGYTAATEEILIPLSQETLQEKIKASRARNRPLMASWDEIRMSLAGAQENSGCVLTPMVRCSCLRVLHPRPISSNRRMPVRTSRVAQPTNFFACAWLMS